MCRAQSNAAYINAQQAFVNQTLANSKATYNIVIVSLYISIVDNEHNISIDHVENANGFGCLLSE